MTDPPGPHPTAVYRRRRALAVGAAVASLVLVAWLVGALVGHGDPASVAGPPSPSSSSPPARAGTPAVASSSSTTPPAPTPPPGPPPPCGDGQVSVVAEVDPPSTPAGQPVGFAIVVSNTGQLPCAKEIGRAVRELVVTTVDGATRLWSSNDCLATAGSEVRVMRPTERFTYGLRWSGTTSRPGCAEVGRLGPGDYLLSAVVAGLVSDPVVFRLT
ncbi:hypothetical protein ACFFSW_18500 [Saccharothrix longispora]|uniref:Repeat protein (TIGR01451 family) n=1 Tax=Saccharothrix longispora TaxID=33920 RepID=A0ABU1Q6H9_9PSEU|nr:hypothetical protein [Saccharothrix longispora]MDR6597734.1 hypothetical protein [Saccharothrix longispora]